MLCWIFRFLFHFCFISTGIHAKWTYLHVLSQTSFFLVTMFLTTRLKVHIWLTHMKTRILCIFTPSLYRQRCTWRCTCFCKCLIIICNFISLNPFLSSLARNTINVISVSSLIQTPVISVQKRGYFHSSMVYLVFQIWIIIYAKQMLTGSRSERVSLWQAHVNNKKCLQTRTTTQGND